MHMERKRFFVRLFKALSNEARLDLMMQLESGEKNVSELVRSLRQKQSSVSHNLHQLIEAGLVRSRHQGAFRYYSLDAHVGVPVVQGMQSYVQPSLKAPHTRA